MLDKKIYFDLDDICLLSSPVVEIKSRSLIDCYYDGKNLPIISAPMDTVVDYTNYKKFDSKRINICLPRNIGLKEIKTKNSMVFYSFGLEEFIEKFIEKEKPTYIQYVCIDIANGHLLELHETITIAKEKYPSLKIMSGNVSHPLAFKELSKAGCDFIRVSVGSGNACTTSVNTAISYPLGSLIEDVYEIKKNENLSSKIVIDGGMKNYDDIFKCLALGADYVMVGSMLNLCFESASPHYIKVLGQYIKISPEFACFLIDYKFNVFKKFRGMSTTDVQKDWNKVLNKQAAKIKASEGISVFRKCKHFLIDFVSEFEQYLKSSMSYTNSKNLSEYIGNVDYIQVTANHNKRVGKENKLNEKK